MRAASGTHLSVPPAAREALEETAMAVRRARDATAQGTTRTRPASQRSLAHWNCVLGSVDEGQKPLVASRHA